MTDAGGAVPSGAAPLFHLALSDEWAAARDAGVYDRSTVGRSLAEEGFIHCSFAEQVRGTADRYYRGRDDVVLLRIAPARLGSEVRVEPVPGGDRFPHVYGPIPLDAVERAEPLRVGSDGRLVLPADLPR
ncbi:MAG TPA: DUF952 domain-containing protein [Acidimicrobiales bacterium]|nr:DUF952 domain-containing protein [Acidimicrobiales bacterium]